MRISDFAAKHGVSAKMLSHDVSQTLFLAELREKQRLMNQMLSEQLQKKLQLNRLIQLIEAEGFSMDKEINLLTLTPDSVHEFKKNMPNTEMFLEMAMAILKEAKEEPYFGVLRLDMNQFASINQQYGFEVGDKVIVACYMAIVDVMEATGRQYAIGRAGGDEFTVMFAGAGEAFESVGRRIAEQMKTIDFRSLGCMRDVGVYVSGVYSPFSHQSELRYLIDETHFTLIRAKQLGVGEVCIEAKQ